MAAILKSSGPRGGGPRLDLREWIILLNIHVSNGGAALGPLHPVIIEASLLLSAYAARVGRARIGSKLRSPEGLSRRLYIFRALARSSGARAPKLARSLMRRFSEDETALRDIAITAKSELAENLPIHGPSHGPTPWAGVAIVVRSHGRVSVYIMRLEEHGVPLRHPGGGTILKIGLSGDVRARTRQLNRHFPPGFGPRWRCCHTVEVATAEDAWRLEQELLADFASSGFSLGGEFVAADLDVAVSLIASQLDRLQIVGHLRTAAQTATEKGGERKGSNGD